MLGELSGTAALTAFALAGGLSLLAGVEPLYAVLRSIVAFAGVLFLTRWLAGLFEAFESMDDEARSGEGTG